jgi:integrase
MREAKRDGIIDKNPVEDVEPMGKDFEPTQALTDEELEALFPVNPTHFGRIWPEFQYGVMFALMVSSGMRPGEARALEWPSVILDIPAVLIVQAVDASDHIGPTKGKEKRGAIIPERTAGLLRKWQEMCESNVGFVFYGARNEFHSRKVVHNQFRKGLKRAGILREERRISMRSLRTTYNTRMRQMLLAHAMPEDLLRFFIGHRSVQMTDRYDSPELEAKLRSLKSVGKQVNGFWD